ncbi:hypothetical protein HMPREF3212_01987 [Citrobacter freundii]|nr:hypothetical protein HMPREF3212_01987 [Citrobacter freundii]
MLRLLNKTLKNKTAKAFRFMRFFCVCRSVIRPYRSKAQAVVVHWG